MENNNSRFTQINDSDPSCSFTYVTIFIYNIDPDIVTRRLGISPTYQQKKDGIRTLPRGETIKNIVNSWLLSSGKYISSKDLRTHLNWLLDKIEPVANKIIDLQYIDGVKMTIRCTWFSAEGLGGPTLWPEQMERMAKLNLECAFSFADYSENKNVEPENQL
jgi:hypothetical protein